jgi:chemotaxis methyl-accepting protein methylase
MSAAGEKVPTPVKRWVSPAAAGTESYRLGRLVDAGDRTEPDHDEGPFYVFATDYDALQQRAAQLEAREKVLSEALLAVKKRTNAIYAMGHEEARRAAVDCWEIARAALAAGSP